MAKGPSEMPEKFAFVAEPPAAMPDKDATTQWPFLVATSRIEPHFGISFFRLKKEPFL